MFLRLLVAWGRPKNKRCGGRQTRVAVPARCLVSRGRRRDCRTDGRTPCRPSDRPSDELTVALRRTEVKYPSSGLYRSSPHPIIMSVLSAVHSTPLARSLTEHQISHAVITALRSPPSPPPSLHSCMANMRAHDGDDEGKEINERAASLPAHIFCNELLLCPKSKVGRVG